MDRSFLIFIAVGFAFFYFITQYVTQLQNEKELYESPSSKQLHQNEKYYIKDSIDRLVLDVEELPPAKQLEVWNQDKKLKKQLAEVFPDFTDMKVFVKERIRGSYLRSRLLRHIDTVQTRFFSGEIDAQKAKKTLFAKILPS